MKGKKSALIILGEKLSGKKSSDDEMSEGASYDDELGASIREAIDDKDDAQLVKLLKDLVKECMPKDDDEDEDEDY